MKHAMIDVNVLRYGNSLAMKLLQCEETFPRERGCIDFEGEWLHGRVTKSPKGHGSREGDTRNLKEWIIF